jgi:hypothetical protein
MSGESQLFSDVAKKKFHVYHSINQESTMTRMKKHFKGNRNFKRAIEEADLILKMTDIWYNESVFPEEKKEAIISRNPPGRCAAQKALVLVLDHNCTPSAMTEKWFHPGRPAQPARRTKKGKVIEAIPEKKGQPIRNVRHYNYKGDLLDDKEFKHGESVPPCETCNLILPFLICAKEKEGKCGETETGGCAKCEGKNEG